MGQDCSDRCGDRFLRCCWLNFLCFLDYDPFVWLGKWREGMLAFVPAVSPSMLAVVAGESSMVPGSDVGELSLVTITLPTYIV